MSAVRIRCSAPDPFNGLRGHAYIKARGLGQQIGPLLKTEAQDNCRCARCAHDRQLAAVQALCASLERRRIADLTQPNWNSTSDEAVHELLDYAEFASV